jgi:hypothetical protein
VTLLFIKVQGVFITAVPITLDRRLCCYLCVCVCVKRECCALVLNSVTSTLQWIRKPNPRDIYYCSTYYKAARVGEGPG